MKLTALAVWMALAAFQQAQCSPKDFFPNRAITLDARLNCPYISSHGGTAYLHVSIATPDVGRTSRKPLNLSVVLDRSGSMAAEGKIDYAKRALSTLIDHLSSEDILSIVVYDDRIDLLREAGPVRDKQALKRLIESVYARGSTNLGGGMIEGFRQVEHHTSKRYVNRVLLLSDGLANQGVTDPHELNRIARRYRSRSIVLTTMGVGLDYNENLMVGLAESGGGNYYFIESPTSLASIFRKEFKMMSSVVAQNAVLELKLGHGVRVNDVIGCEYRPDRESLVIPVGDLYANDRRELTVELWIPPGTGSKTVASSVLRYETSYPGLREEPSFTTRMHYTDDVVVIEKHRDMEVQAKADVAVSTRKVERAMQAVDEGRVEDAAAELDQARQILMASPAASAAGAASGELKQQATRLETFQQLLKDSSDTRRAKKAIQYENYRTQKNK
jgi:Ca-activated chloride channel family protein